jgi:uncharacterized membrane protein
MIEPNFLARATALGAASGLRSTAGLGTLAVHGSDGLGPVLSHRAARPLAAIGVVTELVLDKLPITGSRLEVPGLVGRVVFASLGAVAIARTEEQPVALAVVVASAAALAAAKIGHDVRVALAKRIPDLVVAVFEDSIAIGLAVAAALVDCASREVHQLMVQITPKGPRRATP